MAIYELTADEIRSVDETTFADVGVAERGDLQRLLRRQVDVIAPDCLVISEEFGDWDDSRRRIDLLAVDTDANVVVIELKRTEDGGHMELQAIRYAAMVSTLTFDKAVEIYGRYLQKTDESIDAEASLLQFLGWDEPDEDLFAQDVRIVLASAAFSKELMTAVLWLNQREIDVRCVRMRPYSDGDRVLLDVQQVIPLPEAADYIIQARMKDQKVRRDRTERDQLRTQFWMSLLRLAASKTDLHENISPGPTGWLGASTGVRGIWYYYSITQHDWRVVVYIDRGTGHQTLNKQLFDCLYGNREEIESAYGAALDWQRLDKNRSSTISYRGGAGGYRDDASTWQGLQEKMVSAMIRFDKAFRPSLMRCKQDLL